MNNVGWKGGMVERWNYDGLRTPRRRVLTCDAECGIILTSFFILKKISNGSTYI